MTAFLKFALAALALALALKISLDSLEQLPWVCVQTWDAITGNVDYQATEVARIIAESETKFE